MCIQIRRIVATAELEAIYRFRYTIYVEEMSRKQKDADHVAKTISDSLDRTGFVYGAWDGNEVIGTVRTNDLSNSDIGDYFDLYRLDSLSETDLERTSITTRLMVAPKYRGTSLAMRLCLAMYVDALDRGIASGFIDCNDYLVEAFEMVGYRLHQANAYHPEYGDVTIMRLQLNDLEHLESVRSPFRRACRKYLLENDQPRMPRSVRNADISETGPADSLLPSV